MPRSRRRTFLKIGGAALLLQSVDVQAQSNSQTSLSFEDGSDGDNEPPDPWYVQNHPSGKTCEVSSDRATDGELSMLIGSRGDLEEVQIAVDVDLTQVDTVLYDGYPVENNPYWGDVKVNVGSQTISGDLVGTDVQNQQWYNDIESDTSDISGEKTLYFWVRGDPNIAYFDNFRFQDQEENLLPIADVVAGMESPGGGQGDGPEDSDTIDAQVRSLSVSGSSFTPGDTIEATATVENTGGAEHTFFVGYAAISDGNNNTYDNDGSTGQTITLSSEESGSVDLSLTLPEDTPTGQYTILSSVWRESNPDNLENRLSSASQSVTIEPTTKQDYLSGTIEDVAGNPVQNAYVEAYYRAGNPDESQGSALEAGTQFIADATTDSEGRFEFDGSGEGKALSRSNISQIRDEYSVDQDMGVTMIAQEVPPDSSSMSPGNIWFQGVSFSSGEFFTQDFDPTISLSYQQLFRRLVGGDSISNSNSQCRVYREVDSDKPQQQLLHIELRGSGDVGLVGEGICAFRVSEDLEVNYEDIEYGVWRGGSVTTHPFSVVELGRMGAFQVLPIYPATQSIAFENLSEDSNSSADTWEDAFSGIIGQLPGIGTVSGFVGTMSDILSNDRDPSETVGEMSDYDPNEQDLVRGNWPDGESQYAVNFQVPVTLESSSTETIEARAVWDVPIQGVLNNTESNILGYEFEISANN